MGSGLWFLISHCDRKIGVYFADLKVTDSHNYPKDFKFEGIEQYYLEREKLKLRLVQLNLNKMSETLLYNTTNGKSISLFVSHMKNRACALR